MKIRCLPILAALVLTLASALPAPACTTFCLRNEGRIVFGKNYDWNVGDGMLVVNKRGVARTADANGDPRPARWESKHGSVTFNQYGRDFPSGGINEAGLTIELMWLEGSRYPAADARPAVDVLQWIQYQLDNHATVAEVLASEKGLRINSQTPIHYLVADRKGQVATVEFLNGRMVAHTGKDLPMAALANSTYAESLTYARKQGGDVPAGIGSLNRFARAARRVGAFEAKGADPVAYAFETLDQVAQPGYTQWSIVYEVDRGRVHFRTRDQRKIRSLDLKTVDFSCSTPVRVLDLDADVQGDVAKLLVPYTRDLNRELVTASFRKTPFLAQMPDAELERVARYPESDVCRR
ncbi:MAG TPA: linear amide C-N hydrolase [Thermoanaerobaculia bacterium]|jgi:choloylglycine hydrolase|nr:linear amide C-N hydrolase [Thermoanaerobaculia bacterium]